MINIYEYIIGKNTKIAPSIKPNDIFIRLCEGDINKSKININEICDKINKYLKSESLHQYLECILHKINKAIDRGYILQNNSTVTSRCITINNKEKAFDETTKLLHFSSNLEYLRIYFMDFRRLSICCFYIIDNKKFEFYANSFENFNHMLFYIQGGYFADKKHYISSLSELEELLKKYLDL